MTKKKPYTIVHNFQRHCKRYSFLVRFFLLCSVEFENAAITQLYLWHSRRQLLLQQCKHDVLFGKLLNFPYTVLVIFFLRSRVLIESLRFFSLCFSSYAAYNSHTVYSKILASKNVKDFIFVVAFISHRRPTRRQFFFLFASLIDIHIVDIIYNGI